MNPIHCHMCGGVVRDRFQIEYVPPDAAAQIALTHPGPCTCTRPIVHEDPPIIESPPEPAPGAPP